MNDSREQAKERAGRRAADHVASGMRVGLGSGSTVRYTILALGERRLDCTCVATSLRTQELAEGLGLKVVPPDEIGSVDIAIDGADEVDPAFNLIKGGGGAQTREKIVAGMAARFIVAVDEQKLVDRLGACDVPLEVLAFAPGVVAARVRLLGALEVTRRDQPSDGGNVLLDARFGPIADPTKLACELDAIAGLVEHGLFLGSWVERVVVGGPRGVRELTR